MAEIKKNTTADNAKTSKRVQVRLPRLNGIDAVQDAVYGLNGKNYLIKRGEYVDVPGPIAEIMRNNEQAEDYAMRYIDDLKVAEETKNAQLK